MAFTVSMAFTREDTDTDWYSNSSEWTTFSNAQAAAGNRTSYNVSVSDNGLVQTVTAVWEDEDALDAAKADSKVVAHISARDTYNNSNSITKRRITYEAS